MNNDNPERAPTAFELAQLIATLSLRSTAKPKSGQSAVPNFNDHVQDAFAIWNVSVMATSARALYQELVDGVLTLTPAEWDDRIQRMESSHQGLIPDLEEQLDLWGWVKMDHLADALYGHRKGLSRKQREAELEKLIAFGRAEHKLEFTVDPSGDIDWRTCRKLIELRPVKNTVARKRNGAKGGRASKNRQ